jgi:uncharacterized RDD family membrane protein YckC
MSKKTVMKLSTPGRRLAAFAIDEILPVILGTIWLAQMAILASYGDDYYYYAGYNYMLTKAVILILITSVLLLAYLVVEIIFYVKSQSIGKAILGMRVVRNTDGQPIGIWWMLLRELVVKHASAICFCLGYIWVLIDKKNRAWHDKILDTYVVDIEKPVASVEAPIATPVATPVAESVAETVATPVASEEVIIAEAVVSEEAPVAEAEPVAEEEPEAESAEEEPQTAEEAVEAEKEV